MTDTQVTVGVVAESGADERRVALVPKAVSALVASGVSVVVESGAGQRALLPDELYAEAGATIGDAWAADVVVKVAPPTPEEVARLRSGQTLIGFLAPRNAENQIGALKERGRAGLRGGGDPADLPRPGDGRAVLAGQRGRLQGRGAGAPGVHPVLPDADDGSGHCEAGQRVGSRRRRGRPAGAGHGQTAGRRAPPVTTCARRWPTRSAPWGRSGWISASKRPAGRLRQGADRGGARPAAEEAREGHRRLRCGDHHRPGAGPCRTAAGDRRRGGGDEARQRGRRPGRRDGRQL